MSRLSICLAIMPPISEKLSANITAPETAQASLGAPHAVNLLFTVRLKTLAASF